MSAFLWWLVAVIVFVVIMRVGYWAFGVDPSTGETLVVVTATTLMLMVMES